MLVTICYLQKAKSKYISIKHGLLLTGCWPYGNLISIIEINRNSSKLSLCQYYCMVAPLGLLMNCLEKKLDENYKRMLHAVLNKFLMQHLTKQYVYGHLPPISQTIQVRWARHTSSYLRSNVLQWIPTHGYTSVSQLAKTYIPQLCADTECYLKHLPRAMTNTDKWQERVKQSMFSTYYDNDH